MDTRVGHILEAAKAAGIYEKTTFVLLGDHGCTDFDHIIYLNTFFREEGLLKTDLNKNITHWEAYANSCGGSVQIHISKNCDALVRQRVSDALDKLTVMPNTFVKKVFTKAEASEKYHLSGDFDYVIEPKDGFVFRNGIVEPWIIPRNKVSTDYFLSDHGQLPTHEDLKTLFFAKGNKIKKGVSIDTACIVDEGPTFARILDLEMKEVDGMVLEEILDIS